MGVIFPTAKPSVLMKICDMTQTDLFTRKVFFKDFISFKIIYVKYFQVM